MWPWATTLRSSCGTPLPRHCFNPVFLSLFSFQSHPCPFTFVCSRPNPRSTWSPRFVTYFLLPLQKYSNLFVLHSFFYTCSLYLLQNVSRLEVVCMISLELFARLNPLLQPESLIPLDFFSFLCRAAFLILFFICFFVFFLKGIKKSMEYFLLTVKK